MQIVLKHGETNNKTGRDCEGLHFLDEEMNIG